MKNLTLKTFISGILCTILIFSSIHPSYAATKLINRGDRNKPVMSLTFDDGGSAANVRAVMDIMEANGLKASFFLLGSFMDKNPDLIKEIIERGHEVANHSYSHPKFTSLSRQGIINELNKTSNAFKSATGADILPFVRPPYGDYNKSVLSAITDAGYTHTVMWSIDTNDWTKKPAKDITSHVLTNSANGRIVLMHTLPNLNTVKALPDIISGLESKGYSLVPISELIDPSSVSDNSYTPMLTRLEYLNNLLYAVTGSYYSTEKEVYESAKKLGIVNAEESSELYSTYMDKEKNVQYVQRAFPQINQPQLERIRNTLPKKDNLAQLLEMFLSL